MSTQGRDLIRDCTKAEEDALYRGNRCPFCGGSQFFEGPRGGIATNIYCTNPACDARFNFCPPMTPQVIRESKLPHPMALPESSRTIEAISVPASAPKGHRGYRGLPTGILSGAWLFSIWMIFETLRLHDWRGVIPNSFPFVAFSIVTWNAWHHRRRASYWRNLVWNFNTGAGIVIGLVVMDLLWRIWHGELL